MKSVSMPLIGCIDTRRPRECQGGYQDRPKIHVTRVVFQDQAMYPRTSFRGAKTCKIGNVFSHIHCRANFGKDMTGKLRKMKKIKKNLCKNAYLGSIFIPEKYVIRVLFVSPWTSLIPLGILVDPPPPRIDTPCIQTNALTSPPNLNRDCLCVRAVFTYMYVGLNSEWTVTNINWTVLIWVIFYR